MYLFIEINLNKQRNTKMARLIFGGKKIDAPVFCLVWLFQYNRRVAEKTLSLLVFRYFILSSCFFRHLGAFVLKLERSAGSLLKKECYSGEDENPPKPGP